MNRCPCERITLRGSTIEAQEQQIQHGLQGRRKEKGGWEARREGNERKERKEETPQAEQ